MRDDYKLQGSLNKITIEVEERVSKDLEVMTQYTKLTPSEIVNTALKRFILTHKDYFPSTRHL